MYYIRWMLGIFVILFSLATWVPAVRIAGVGPDLMLGAVFTLGVLRGPAWGVWSGFVLGLLLGVEQPSSLGIDSLALGVAGLAAGRLLSGFDRGNPIVLLALLFVCAVLAETVRAVWIGLESPASILGAWVRWGLPGALYTTLALPLIGWALARIVGKRGWFAVAS